MILIRLNIIIIDIIIIYVFIYLFIIYIYIYIYIYISFFFFWGGGGVGGSGFSDQRPARKAPESPEISFSGFWTAPLHVFVFSVFAKMVLGFRVWGCSWKQQDHGIISFPGSELFKPELRKGLWSLI